MSKLAIIPARGGSKRIPRKNIKIFLGKPIIAYSIEAALQSNLFDEVMVSTDDNEIAKIALQYGAKVPFMRSAHNASDGATTFEVIEEVINHYKLEGQHFEHACCIYPTAPFTTPQILDDAHLLLKEHKYDSVFPAVKYGHPIQRAFEIQKNGTLKLLEPQYLTSCTQELKASFHDAGQFYWIDIEECLLKQKIITDNSGVLTLLETEVQDIDSEVDWKLAELKYQLIHGA